MGHEHRNCFLIGDRSFEAELDSGVRIHLLFLPSCCLMHCHSTSPFSLACVTCAQAGSEPSPLGSQRGFFQNIRALGPKFWLNAPRLQFQDKKTHFYKLPNLLSWSPPPLSLVEGHVCAAGTLGVGGGTILCV